MTHRAVVAIGSNLGDRAASLNAAVAHLRAHPDVHVVAVSTFIETVAVTPQGPDPVAPAFLNGVVLIETSVQPSELHRILQDIEVQAGRVRGERWGDRTLDCDLIDFEGAEISSEELTVPHPRAHERSFVLDPWLEIDPHATLGNRGSIADLRKALQ